MLACKNAMRHCCAWEGVRSRRSKGTGGGSRMCSKKVSAGVTDELSDRRSDGSFHAGLAIRWVQIEPSCL